MAIQIERACVQSLYRKIVDILYDNSFVIDGVGRNATISMSFPTKDDWQSIIKPLVIVNYLAGADTPKEIGSEDVTRANFIIDLYAIDDGQRDDLGYIIRKSLRNKVFSVYDFENGYPIAPNNYTGISTRGQMTIFGTSFFNEEPDIDEAEQTMHHQEIRLNVEMPLDV